MKAFICATIGRDAEAKTIGGHEYSAISLPDRISKDETRWVNVLYRRNGLHEHLRKGAIVSVTGRLSANTYTSKDGETKVDLTIWADTLEMVKFAPNETPTSAPTPASSTPNPFEPKEDFPF